MRPIKLNIKGFNSFIEEQIIEFDKLTERGLFGIFGPTGSGKSTILDAITMAMYGDIARNTSEFINSNVDSASISYEFEVGRGSERHRYIVERNIKKKPDGGYRTSLVRVREVKDGKHDIISSGDGEVKKKIVELIGLNSDDFTRSVVLPQGKFNEFLKLKGQERRNMFERIFRLEKYGAELVKKIRNVKNEKLTERTRLEGELGSYSGVSEEACKTIEEELKQLQGEEKALKDEQKKLDDEYKRLKDVWDNQSKLNQLLQKKDKLDEKLLEIETKKIQLDFAKRAFNVNPFVDNLNQTIGKISDNDEEATKIAEVLTDIDQQVKVTAQLHYEALERKNNRIPELIKKEGELSQALELEREIEKLQDQISEIQKEFNLNLEGIGQHNDKSKEIEAKINDLNLRLEQIDIRIDAIKVEPEYRESIEEAAEIEKEFKKLGKDKKRKEEKARLLKEDIDKREKEYSELVEQRDNIEKNANKTFGDLQLLQSNCPGDSNTLLNKQSYVTSIEASYNTARENKDKLDEMQLEYGKILSFINEKTNEEKRVKDKISDNEKALEQIEAEIEALKIANMAGILAAEMQNESECPVCGSTHHPRPAEYVATSEIKNKEKVYKKIKEDNKGLKEDALNLHGEIQRLDGEEKRYREEIAKTSKALEGISIEDLAKSLEEAQNQFRSLQESIDKWNNEKLDLEKCHKEQSNAFSDHSTKCAAVGEGLRKDTESLKELNEELAESITQYALLEEKYSNLKLNLQIEDFEEKMKIIKKDEKEIQELQKEAKKIIKNNEVLKADKEIEDGKARDLVTRNLEIEGIRNIYSKDIEFKQDKVKTLSDDKEPGKYLEDVCNEKEEITNNENVLNRKLEREKQEKQELENKKAGIQKNTESLKQILEGQKAKLEKVLKDNGFEESETVKGYLLPEKDIKELQTTVDEFTKEYNLVVENISSINKELNGQSVDEERWVEITDRIEELVGLLEQKNQDIGAKKEILKDMNDKLKKAMELLEERSKIQHSLDLLEDLDKLVAGNKFVEYIAMNQLEYIAKEASKRLKEITKERYALELNQDGGFVMRDDFNGGTRRATDTLSGGETFLTSLSLALALSSQIQLRGNAPLEFFFLDEGFGTLDTELLEVVMSSLERLHSDKLCVGIISHVEELKNRVPVKLIVSPAQQGGEGSKVKVEYS